MARFIKMFAAAAMVVAGLAAPSFAQGPARSPLATNAKSPTTVKSPLAGQDGQYQKAREDLVGVFPNLRKAKYEILGPETGKYNCVGWIFGTTTEWVWPGENIEDFDKFIGAFSKKLVVDGQARFVKFQRLDTMDYSVRDGKEKIVLYGVKKDGQYVATHVARQMPDGTWTSKPGGLALIQHESPDDLDGDSYGTPIAVYERDTK